MRKVIQKDYKLFNKRIYEYWNRQRRMPTFEDLKNLFDVRSKDTVSRIVNDLVSMGHILKDKTGKLLPVADDILEYSSKVDRRKIQRLINNNTRQMRMLGLVQAGFPTHVEAQDLESVNLEEWLVGDKDATFMLRVKGDSMIDAGIVEDDYVIVERGKEAKINDVVLAEVDGSWTLKYYKKDKQGIYLEPANKKFKIIRPENDLNIAAVVVAQVRKYGK